VDGKLANFSVTISVSRSVLTKYLQIYPLQFSHEIQ